VTKLGAILLTRRDHEEQRRGVAVITGISEKCIRNFIIINLSILSSLHPTSLLMASEGEHIVKLKGFSLDVTKKDIKDFYIQLDIKEKDINLLRYPDGRSTGYAFLRLKNSNEIDLALLQDNRYMGNQYVSVTKSSLEEMTMIQSLVDQKKPIYVLRSAEATAARSIRDRSPVNKYDSGSPPMLNIDEGSNVVFVMGIPSRKGYKEVRRFFSGCRIQPGGVYLCCGDSDRHNGTAYVEFVDQAECAKAKDRDGCLMGENCVVVSACSKEEMLNYLKKYPSNDTKNNWTETYTTSNSSSERKVYHSRSERRVHRSEDGSRTEEADHRLGGFEEGGGWLLDESPPTHRESKDMYLHHDMEGDSSGRHKRHHSRGHRSHSSSGGYHSSNGSDRKVHRHHRNEEEDGLHQGEQFYSRKHYRGDSYHHRSSRHRDEGYMEGSSYLDNSSGDWTKLDTSLGSGTGESDIDPLLALELLKTAAQVSGSQRGISSSSTSLYSSAGHSRRGYDDQPPPISSHYSSSSKGIVLMEGLPYEATIGDILDFFRNYNLTYENVRIQCRDDGSPSGKAFVTFLDGDTAKLAARQLNKGYIGGRYVELKLV